MHPAQTPVRKSHTEVLVTFGCNGDVHWAECVNGLSTELLIAAHPEEKVKGEVYSYHGMRIKKHAKALE